MPKKVAAILEAILIIKNIGATDSDTQKVAAIQYRRYFIGDINNPVQHEYIDSNTLALTFRETVRSKLTPALLRFLAVNIVNLYFNVQLT
jgi:hypothetical protein